jgi:hypothetical protein
MSAAEFDVGALEGADRALRELNRTMFGHLIADRASTYCANEPRALPALFKKLRSDCADDPERLSALDCIEEMAVSLIAGEHPSIAAEMGYEVLKPKEDRRRKRKVTLAAALKEAAKTGLHVNGAVIEAGKIELKFGEAADGGAADGETDAWIRKHAH